MFGDECASRDIFQQLRSYRAENTAIISTRL